MSEELLKKIQEQVQLADEYQFPYVVVNMPLEEARKLLKEQEASKVAKE